MSYYLKERFAEYMTVAKSHATIQATAPKQKKEDLYLDFEVLYHGTDVVLECFSMSKAEVERNFQKSLIKNLIEVLEIHSGNIRFLSGDVTKSLCEINYTGAANNFITHEIKQITTRVEEPFSIDEDVYNDLDESLSPDDDNFNPYAGNFWSDQDIYCIRCGFRLRAIQPQHKMWGDFAWDVMKSHKTQWFLCSNRECYHTNAPLILHDPIKGWTKPSDGKSYSVSWVK